MVVYNYTKISKRDKRIYSVFNSTVSREGVAMSTLKCCAGSLLAFTVFGLAFCKLTGKMWYNPLLFLSNMNVGYFYMVFILCPIFLGVWLNNHKIQGYRVIDFVILYVQPKRMIDHNGKAVKIEGVKYDTWVERL